MSKSLGMDINVSEYLRKGLGINEADCMLVKCNDRKKKKSERRDKGSQMSLQLEMKVSSHVQSHFSTLGT